MKAPDVRSNGARADVRPNGACTLGVDVRPNGACTLERGGIARNPREREQEGPVRPDIGSSRSTRSSHGDVRGPRGLRGAPVARRARGHGAPSRETLRPRPSFGLTSSLRADVRPNGACTLERGGIARNPREREQEGPVRPDIAVTWSRWLRLRDRATAMSGRTLMAGSPRGVSQPHAPLRPRATFGLTSGLRPSFGLTSGLRADVRPNGGAPQEPGVGAENPRARWPGGTVRPDIAVTWSRWLRLRDRATAMSGRTLMAGSPRGVSQPHAPLRPRATFGLTSGLRPSFGLTSGLRADIRRSRP